MYKLNVSTSSSADMVHLYERMKNNQHFGGLWDNAILTEVVNKNMNLTIQTIDRIYECREKVVPSKGDRTHI